MKKIFLICLSAGFVSNGFAQSSVADVPENKIKPSYETVPAIKSQAVSTLQKVVTPQLVLNAVGLNAHVQPNLQPTPVVTKPVEATKAEPTVPSRMVGISATPTDMPVKITQQPVPTPSVQTKIESSVVPTVPATQGDKKKQ